MTSAPPTRSIRTADALKGLLEAKNKNFAGGSPQAHRAIRGEYGGCNSIYRA
jgi:hypothetical protein